MCVCIYPYTHTHVRIRTHVHTYMHTCVRAYMHACIHAYMHALIHAYMHTCLHACTHIRSFFLFTGSTVAVIMMRRKTLRAQEHLRLRCFTFTHAQSGWCPAWASCHQGCGSPGSDPGWCQCRRSHRRPHPGDDRGPSSTQRRSLSSSASRLRSARGGTVAKARARPRSVAASLLGAATSCRTGGPA